MPAPAIKAKRVVACHVCANKEVRVTTKGLLRRHMNTRGYVCSGSTQEKQNRIRVVR